MFSMGRGASSMWNSNFTMSLNDHLKPPSHPHSRGKLVWVLQEQTPIGNSAGDDSSEGFGAL